MRMIRTRTKISLFFILFLLMASIIPYSPFIDNSVKATPTYQFFGYDSGAFDAGFNMTNIQWGSSFLCSYNTKARNITAYIKAFTVAQPMKCALYNNATKAFIGSTEEKTPTVGGYQWVTFNFSTNYSLSSGTTYLMGIFSGGTKEVRIGYTLIHQGGIGYITEDTNAYPGWSDPWVSAGGNNYYLMMYIGVANWVERPPSFSNPSPSSSATGIRLYHATNITVNDADGNSTTVCFWNNKTGSWVKTQQNNSVTANTTVRDINASWCTDASTKYWWKVTAYDGHVNSSVTYNFTTQWVNRAPTFSYPLPLNISTGKNRYHATNVTVTDLDGNTTTICFWTNASGSWLKAQQNNTVASGTIVRDTNASYTSAWDTTYWWKITAYDGHVNVSVIYHFKTRPSSLPSYSGPLYYVSWSTGSDGNSGDFTHPFQSIEHAIPLTDSGDTIYIMAGTYIPETQMDVTGINTLGSWWTLRNYNTDKVIIDGMYCSKSNWIDAVFDFYNCNYIHISGITINHSARGGITFRSPGGGSPVSYAKVDNCSITNNSQHAIKAYSTNNLTIEYNYIYNNFCNWSGIKNSDDGGLTEETISLTAVVDFSINNNTLKGNRELNIDAKSGSSRGEICYNTINTTAGYVLKQGWVICGNDGIYIDAGGVIKNISIFNNLIYGNKTGISINNEAATGHYEYIYIYNNIVNITTVPFGVTGPAGRNPIAIGNDGGSVSVYHHIYIYNNLFRTGIGNDYSVFQVGSFAGGDFTLTNLDKLYIMNNIFYSTYVGTTRMLRLAAMDFTLFTASIITLANNSFYRTSGNLSCYWGTTIYYNDSHPEKFGLYRVSSNPKFIHDADQYADFRLNSTSPCINVGNITHASLYDFFNVSRPQGIKDDIGPFEYYSGPYYVATTGSDLFAGVPWKPFRTILYGCNATSDSGILYLRGGTFIVASVSVVHGTRIIMRSYPGEIATIT